jgi:subtilisin family serine protease
MDTGIDTDHPDLNAQKKSPYAISFYGNSIEDLNGHGTHVAGIAAAKDNGIGVVGVSAGAKVVPVKVLDDTGNSDFSILIAALNHVAQYSIPGDVVNMSLGGFIPDCGILSYPALPSAIMNLASAGVWISIAAGNDNNNATFYLPGCINNTRVFTVAAIDCNSACAVYTNLGENVDWYAVGTNVYSTYKDGGYATLSGTSMATPVVAGIIHSRGQAPVRGPIITCQDLFGNDIIKPLALRQ